MGLPNKRGAKEVREALSAGPNFDRMRRAVRHFVAANTSSESIAAEVHLWAAFAPLLRTVGPRLTDRRKAAIRERDGRRCVRCGERQGAFSHHVDHLWPHILGGANQEWNLATLCPRCNAIKGNALHAWALLRMIEQAEEAR